MLGITPDDLSLNARTTLLNGLYDFKGSRDNDDALIEALHFMDIDIILTDGRRLNKADKQDTQQWNQQLHLDSSTLETEFIYTDKLKIHTRLAALHTFPATPSWSWK